MDRNYNVKKVDIDRCKKREGQLCVKVEQACGDIKIDFTEPIRSTAKARGRMQTARRTNIRAILGISRYGNESENDFEIIKKKASKLIENYVK